MISFARLMLAALRFELAISREFMGPAYLAKLRQDIAHWEGIEHREEIQHVR